MGKLCYEKGDFMNIKVLIAMLFITLCLFGIGGCNSHKAVSNNGNSYEQISADEAKALMDSETDYAIVDARTQEEFDEGHIEGAIMIPEYEIEAKAESLLPDKDQLILVYCRSGRRSKIASEALVGLGYTNVKEFGSIIDWPYDIVK